MKQNIMQINRQTYEEFFVLYADDELTITEKLAVEEFVRQNPDLATEFQLMRQTVLVPDEGIIFENKELLYREEERKVVYMRWFRMSAAAILLLTFSIIGWLFIDNKETNRQPVAVVERPVPVTTPPAPLKEESQNENAEVQSKTESNPRIKEPSRLSTSKKRLEYVNSNYSENNTRATGKTDLPAEQDIAGNENQKTDAALNVPGHVLVRQETVIPDPAVETITVAVTPREMESDVINEDEKSDVSYAFEQEASDSDMIYFANTSLTKKTKLRGVLRKASRYLDRVTSLQ